MSDGAERAQRALTRLLEVMRRLRDPQGGCPWDLAQDFASIAPYTIEEAYEVADAIGRGVPKELESELGDLLFQVVFHARMAQERGWFDFNDVATSIHDKLIRRHPHVFGDAVFDNLAEQTSNWEEHKARERAAAAARRGENANCALGDVPQALPALMRVKRSASRSGT